MGVLNSVSNLNIWNQQVDPRRHYMIKLLIIADDFTGVLDTGEQFAKKGVTTYVMLDF